MKLINIFFSIVFISISSQSYAQEFYTYKLFDNKFQAVFPEEPKISPGFPRVISGVRVFHYQYNEPNNKFFIVTNSQSSALDKNVVKYKKSSIDKGIKNFEKIGVQAQPGASDYSLMNFSSKFDRKKNAYVATYTFSFSINGRKVFKSSKKIIQNKKEYKWSVMYFSLNDKYIFDKYKNHSNVLN
ncbi:MAG: hypothetical protein QM479_05270 [Pseudomonadota bacterium]